MATTLTYTDMIASYPQFTTGDLAEQSRVTAYIVLADTQINASAAVSLFGDSLNFVTLTLAAHLLALSKRDNEATAGGAGAVTARTTGEQITSFSVQTKGDGYDVYRTTPYGQTYLTFLQNLDLTPFVSN
jgi:hypothetical protein